MTGSRRDAYVDTGMEVPGGQCMACRIRLTREWAVRAMHESTFHEHCVFATLTYSDENLPFPGTLVPDHLTKFHKRLRKRRPRLRLLACGEYGDDTKRPHYHGLYFGLHLDDKELLKMVDGKPLYRSDKLDKLWGHGMCNFYDTITPQSAGYVAGYTKKKTGAQAEEFYTWMDDETGEIRTLAPEFKTQSNRPGIGEPFVMKWIKDIFPRDEVILDGKAIPPPRYYEKLCEKHFPDLWLETKKRRNKKNTEKTKEYRTKSKEDKSKIVYKGSDRHGLASERILKSQKLSRNKHS